MKFKNLTCSGLIRPAPFSGPPCRACAQRWKVEDNENCVGAATSAFWSPALLKNIGSVLVDSSNWAIGAEVEIDMLGDRRIGKITGLPFNASVHLN